MCNDCPVTCVSEANLQKHIEREHSNKDPDEGFVLHEGKIPYSLNSVIFLQKMPLFCFFKEVVKDVMLCSKVTWRTKSQIPYLLETWFSNVPIVAWSYMQIINMHLGIS